MTTEDLKIRITADAGGAAAGIKAVKDELNGMGNAAFNANKKTGLGMRELQYNIEQVRSLQFADIIIGQLDKVSVNLSKTKDAFKDAMKYFKFSREDLSAAVGNFSFADLKTRMIQTEEYIKGFFSKKNWDSKYVAQSLKDAGQGWKRFGDGIASFDAVISQLVGGPGMVLLLKFIAAFALVVGTIKAATSAAQRLSASFYEAQKIGMNHAVYQEWAYVMGQVGVEADKLSDFMKTLAAAQNDLRDGTETMVNAFEALGLSAEEAAGMSQEQLFTETVKRLQQVENQVERTSLAYRIFGEDDAAQMTNILNLSNQEMERMISNFYLLGGSASDSAVKKSRMFSASVSNLKLAWQGFTNSIGEAILPALTAIVDALTKAVVAVNLFIRTVFGFDLVAKGSKDTIAGTTVNLDGYTGSLESATAAAEELKRTTQGFDELNIVSNPKTSGASVGDLGGGSSSAISIPDLGMEGLTKDLGLEELTKWFSDNAEEIKKWTKIVVTATATWETFRLAMLLFAGKNIGIFSLIATFPKFVGWIQTVIGLLIEGNSLWAVLGVALPKTTKLITGIGAAFGKIGASIAGAAKAVAAFIGGLSAGAIAIIIAVIAALASAVYFCVQNWDGLVQAVKNFFAENIQPKLETIGAMFSAMGGALQEVWAALLNIGVTIWEAFPEPVQETLRGFGFILKEIGLAIWGVITAIGEWIVSIDWLYYIGQVFEWLGGFVVGILGGVIGGAINGVMSLIQGCVEIITGIVQIISGLVSGLINLIVGLFTGDFSKALDSVELIWDGIVNVFKGAYDATIGVVVEFVEGIIDWFVELWDVLVGHSIVPDMIEAIIDWFFKLPGELIGMMADFVRDIIAWFASLATQAGEWAGTMWGYIKEPFLRVGSWFKERFTEAWNAIKNIFRSVGSWFRNNVVTPITGVFSDIGSKIGKAVEGTFSKAVNVVLSTAVKIINGFISAINAAISLINEIPGVSISKLDKLEVPELATGGIVMGDTLARIGEGGKREAVLPLDQNTGWMDMLADRIANRSSAPTKVVLMVNERELGWASIDGINGITKQTGGIQLQLV